MYVCGVCMYVCSAVYAFMHVWHVCVQLYMSVCIVIGVYVVYVWRVMYVCMSVCMRLCHVCNARMYVCNVGISVM